MPLFFEQHRRARLLETVIETIKKLSELQLLVENDQGKHEAKKDIAVAEWNIIVV